MMHLVRTDLVCVFCLADPLGTGPYDPAPMHGLSDHGYPLCEDHLELHGARTFAEFSAFLGEAMTSSSDDPTVQCPVCATEFEPGDELTGPCRECGWAAPYPGSTWRLAWIAGKRRHA